MIMLNQDHIKKVVGVIKAPMVSLNFNSQLAWMSSFLICRLWLGVLATCYLLTWITSSPPSPLRRDVSLNSPAESRWLQEFFQVNFRSLPTVSLPCLPLLCEGTSHWTHQSQWLQGFWITFAYRSGSFLLQFTNGCPSLGIWIASCTVCKYYYPLLSDTLTNECSAIRLLTSLNPQLYRTWADGDFYVEQWGLWVLSKIGGNLQGAINKSPFVRSHAFACFFISEMTCLSTRPHHRRAMALNTTVDLFENWANDHHSLRPSNAEDTNPNSTSLDLDTFESILPHLVHPTLAFTVVNLRMLNLLTQRWGPRHSILMIGHHSTPL